MAYVTNKSRVLTALRTKGRSKGQTAATLADKLQLGRDSIYNTISTLRKEGHDIVGTVNRQGLTAYRMA